MQKHIYDETNGLTYTLCGDYYLPDLEPPETPKVGKYGLLRLEFLRKSKRPLFTGLLLSGKLNEHLEEIDRTANAMFDRLTKQYAEREGVNEKLKAENQPEWVRRMNGIRERVDEIILVDLINN